MAHQPEGAGKAVSFTTALEGEVEDRLAAVSGAPVVEVSKGPLILLVEDNPVSLSVVLPPVFRREWRRLGETGSDSTQINRQFGIKRMLTSLHDRVITSNDGEETMAAVLAQNVAIDTILMDRSMPKMGEIAATRAIRRMETEGRLKRRRPIIAVTAVVGAEAQKECRDAGMDGFLPKPVELGKVEGVWGYGLARARGKMVGRCIGFNNGEWRLDRIWSLKSIW